jgi:hypothetical protein
MEKYWGEGRDFISGGRKSVLFLEGSQKIPTCPSYKDRVIVKALRYKTLRRVT